LESSSRKSRAKHFKDVSDIACCQIKLNRFIDEVVVVV
jgi:hypothetical protein